MDVLTPATPGGITVGLNAPGVDKAAIIPGAVLPPPDGTPPPDLKAVVPKDGGVSVDAGDPELGINHGGVPPGQPPTGGGVYTPL